MRKSKQKSKMIRLFQKKRCLENSFVSNEFDTSNRKIVLPPPFSSQKQKENFFRGKKSQIKLSKEFFKTPKEKGVKSVHFKPNLEMKLLTFLKENTKYCPFYSVWASVC